jgi:hypothetical protein
MDRISSESLILITVPRTWRLYLLIAVWVIPRMSATSFCFILYDWVSSNAMKARIDGTSDLTAISQGSSIGFTESICIA